MMRLEDDYRREYLREMDDLRGLLEIGGDSKSSPELKRIINDGKHAEKFHPDFGVPSGTQRK